MPPNSGPLTPKPWRHFSAFLFCAAILAPVLSFALAPVPLSLDGGSHIYNAEELRQWCLGDPFTRQYFALNSVFTPNWLASVVAALITFRGFERDSLIAMNLLLVSAVLAGTVLLVRKTGSGLNLAPPNFYILTALVPLAVNIFILVSFWGFLLSTALCLVALAKLQNEGGFRGRMSSLALLLLAYWAHPLPVLLTTFVPLALRPASARHLAGKLFPWMIADGLVLAFTIRLAGDHQRIAPVLRTISARLLDLSSLHAIRELSPSSTASMAFVGYVGLLAFGAFWPGAAENRLRSALKAFVIALLLFYLVCPESVGNGSAIPQRILWMAILICGVLAANSPAANGRLYPAWTALFAASITLVFAGQYFALSRSIQPAVGEIDAALTNLPEHSRVLILSYRLTPDCARNYILDATQPERHLAVLRAAQRHLLIANDYEAATNHFPLVYRSSAYAQIVDEFRPGTTDPRAWHEALLSAPPVDFVVSWGVPDGRRGCGAPVDPPLFEPLRRVYDLRSENRGVSRVQIWARRR